jgi:hypothetical protein
MSQFSGGGGGGSTPGTITDVGGGTTNVLQKATGAKTIGDSSITDDGTTVSTPEDMALSSGKVIKWNNDTGISRNAAATLNFGNGTQGNTTATLSANLYQAVAGFQVTAFGAFSGVTGGTRWIYNNGTIAGTAANLTLSGLLTNYNSIALVDNGLASEVGHLDLTAQNAAITATTIYTPTATGRFRISVYEKVTTAASVSSILGGATGTVLTFTDGTDSVAQSITMGLDNQGGTLALTNSGNSTTTSLNGDAFIYAKTGVPIQIAIGYSSTNAGEMIFALRATCEAL